VCVCVCVCVCVRALVCVRVCVVHVCVHEEFVFQFHIICPKSLVLKLVQFLYVGNPKAAAHHVVVDLCHCKV